MKLELERCEWMGDWWVLKAGGKHVSDASVEGALADWRDVANGILSGEGKSFRRCAAEPVCGEWQFYSPRNTQGGFHIATDAEARELAEAILTLEDRR